jgi:hypothetical protein
MSRYAARSCSFRPQLERLESRELPSSISSQTTALAKDYATLQAGVAVLVNLPATPGGVLPADIAQRDSSNINGDLTSLQSDYNSLKSSAKSAQTLLFLGLFFSGGNTTEELFYLVGLGVVGKADQQLSSLPGQVSSLGTQSLTNFNFTVDDVVNLFGFSSLRIT